MPRTALGRDFSSEQTSSMLPEHCKSDLCLRPKLCQSINQSIRGFYRAMLAQSAVMRQ